MPVVVPAAAPRWSYVEPSTAALIDLAGAAIEYLVVHHGCDHAKLDTSCAICEAKVTLWHIEERADPARRSAAGVGGR